MGYSYNYIMKVVSKRDLFKDKNILTLGTLYPFLSKRDISRLNKIGLNTNVPDDRFSKYLFVDYLGARSCCSLDVSDYQGSNIICNLNQSLPELYQGAFDVIIDAGTLEHLSNLSVALTNIFGLLKESGIYYFGVPCNNWVDHGFFQFSPTFFRDLCIENSSLELLELEIASESKTFSYFQQSPAFLSVLLRSSHRLGVTGIIQKKASSITLDLVQSKYRDLYAAKRDNGSERKEFNGSGQLSISVLLRSIVNQVLYRFCQSNLIPLVFKEYILNGLYRLKKRYLNSNKKFVK